MAKEAKVLKLHKWKCLRCGHEWTPRQEMRPRICPKCKTAYWDRQKQRTAGSR